MFTFGIVYRIGKGMTVIQCISAYKLIFFRSESILQSPSSGSNTTSLKAFDLCQSAATYISTIGKWYNLHSEFQDSS